MKIRRLKGVVDRVVTGVAAIVPDDRSPEVYVSAKDIPNAKEGLHVELVIIPQDDPNAVCPVVGRKPARRAKPIKMGSFAGLVRQMIKVRDRLKATQNQLGETGETYSEDLQEKIDFLEKGIAMFSK